ncbi:MULTISPECIES: hypothetical protein [unclassified Curtobacterium]|uniref:hypothetical protein n=1 Tax=unclassified Curtobacterium TaxID=257496 RepID=UPI000DA7F275|nr:MULTISPECIES: hypothetical protein [unclassified Curtobacterium]PZE28700.1 hypothetical protein DEI86_02675 [Curtobacterium sp. MCBD17_028]PZE77053.1 hypothetical protein DEI82_03750 [Curtobacterium sp. MCBD17_019]PZF59272.1 hypothetical protein DEI92_09810 [Curtobacterium sp. MCBD17_034]PZF65073.1 hypothetical protein DEI81_02920 [Curtobacterium sp. MCBD17_013]PZM34186.1 hypothetical protein DEI90_08325 [Curtobacterium sp. MCBD17_031]
MTEPGHDQRDPAAAAEAAAASTSDSVLQGDLTRPMSEDTQSGAADYVATNTGGVSAERRNPLPDEEQGRGTEYDPVDQGPQQEGQGG